MQLSIQGVKNIKRCEVKLSDRITIIAGKTGAGKTAIAQILGCLYTGETLPPALGLKKNTAAMMLNAPMASASLVHPSAGTVSITWPQCKAHNATLKCSLYAAGLAKPTSIPAKELAKLLGIMPTKEDLTAQLQHVNAPIDEVWAMVESKGWDDAHGRATNKGRELKGAWEHTTGDNYGKDKVLSWMPQCWTGRPVEELTDELAKAKQFLEAAVRTDAISDSQRAELTKLAAEQPDALGKMVEFEKNMLETQGLIDEAFKALEKLPRVQDVQHQYDCWNCGKAGVLNDGKFVEPTKKPSQKEWKASMDKLDKQKAVIKELETKREEATNSFRTQQQLVNQCNHAARRLEVLSEDKPKADIEALKEEVSLVERQIAAHHRKIEADTLANECGMNTYLAAVLSPDGLRKDKLTENLTPFNELLEIISENGGWKKVALDATYLTTTFDGRPYGLLSEGEQFLVNFTFQVALAKLDGSQIVIVDSAEPLDADCWNGIVAVLDSIPLPSVLTMTESRRAIVPDLEEKGLGFTYWVNAGVVESLKVPA